MAVLCISGGADRDSCKSARRGYAWLEEGYRARLKREIFTVEREQAPYWNQSPLSSADEVGVDPWLLLSSYFILKVNGPTLCHKT